MNNHNLVGYRPRPNSLLGEVLEHMENANGDQHIVHISRAIGVDHGAVGKACATLCIRGLLIRVAAGLYAMNPNPPTSTVSESEPSTPNDYVAAVNREMSDIRLLLTAQGAVIARMADAFNTAIRSIGEAVGVELPEVKP